MCLFPLLQALLYVSILRPTSFDLCDLPTCLPAPEQARRVLRPLPPSGPVRDRQCHRRGRYTYTAGYLLCSGACEKSRLRRAFPQGIRRMRGGR